MDGKKVALVVLALCAICCICTSVFAALFGKFEVNGKCSYKGPLAAGECPSTSVTPNGTTPTPTKTEEPDANSTRYNGSDYSIDYPKGWFVDNTPSIQGADIAIYQFDPSNTQGNTNDNISVSKVAQGFKIDLAECEDYADQVYTSAKASYSNLYESITLDTTEVIKIDGQDSCHVVLNSVVGGYDLVQHQYVLSSTATNKSYIITTTQLKTSSNASLLSKAALSFDAK